MLTRRQQWRRASVRKPEPFVVGTPPCSPVNSADDIEHMRGQRVGDTLRAPPSKLRVEKKCVRFSKDVLVVLIPTRQELRACNLPLCWTLEEIASFQEEAIRDIRLFAELKGISLTDARRELYQPHPDDLCCASEDIVIKLRRDSVLKLLPSSNSANGSSLNFTADAPEPSSISCTAQDEAAVNASNLLATSLRQWVVPTAPAYLQCS